MSRARAAIGDRALGALIARGEGQEARRAAKRAPAVGVQILNSVRLGAFCGEDEAVVKRMQSLEKLFKGRHFERDITVLGPARPVTIRLRNRGDAATTQKGGSLVRKRLAAYWNEFQDIYNLKVPAPGWH